MRTWLKDAKRYKTPPGSVLGGNQQPWVQFNPLSLMNANKGVFGVNLGQMWGEVARMRRWMDQLESEGLGIMVADMGLQSWGLPDLEVIHAPE
jgi:hypothetical protein